MGRELTRAGIEFTIFERGSGFGGTWRNNTYPGAACDVPSHFYSFSFALNPRWTKTYAGQPEILAYLEAVAAELGLRDHLVTGAEVRTLRWSDDDQMWTLTTDRGQQQRFDAVISAVGMLDVPHIPDIPGAEGFGGRSFHSSAWDHSRSTTGERVAVIGTGASSIQFVPAIAQRTAHLTVFQRSPSWVAPRFDEPFTAEQQDVFARDPAEALKIRDAALEQYESADFSADGEQTRAATEIAREYLRRKIADPQLRAKLTPTHQVGCKRPLQSREWFPALVLPNVWVETSPIVEFTERGLRTADGAEHVVDTVIYGTGFRAADYLASLEVYGRCGVALHDQWREGAEAYLGTLVPQFPNLFTLYGPNTNGVTSIIYILEAQARYTRRLLGLLTESGKQALEVRPEAHRRYNERIQDAMRGSVWLSECSNYYRHPNGKVVTQFPYNGRTFVNMLEELQLEDYQFSARDMQTAR